MSECIDCDGPFPCPHKEPLTLNVGGKCHEAPSKRGRAHPREVTLLDMIEEKGVLEGQLFDAKERIADLQSENERLKEGMLKAFEIAIEACEKIYELPVECATVTECLDAIQKLKEDLK